MHICIQHHIFFHMLTNLEKYHFHRIHFFLYFYFFYIFFRVLMSFFLFLHISFYIHMFFFAHIFKFFPLRNKYFSFALISQCQTIFFFFYIFFFFFVSVFFFVFCFFFFIYFFGWLSCNGLKWQNCTYEKMCSPFYGQNELLQSETKKNEKRRKTGYNIHAHYIMHKI